MVSRLSERSLLSDDVLVVLSPPLFVEEGLLDELVEEGSSEECVEDVEGVEDEM